MSGDLIITYLRTQPSLNYHDSTSIPCLKEAHQVYTYLKCLSKMNT